MLDGKTAAITSDLRFHRVQQTSVQDVCDGIVRWEPVRSIWISSMALAAVIGGIYTFNWSAFALFAATTVTVLLLGHSLGMHRKLIHDSFQCPQWLEYFLIYFDLLDTTYTLTPIGDKTQLDIQMRYRVSTQFNWYADPIAQWLIGNFAEVILRFYRQRSENR